MEDQIKKTTVYLPEHIHARLQDSAKANKRSFNSELVWALEQYLEKGKKRDKKP